MASGSDSKSNAHIEVAAFVRDQDSRVFLENYLRDAAGAPSLAGRGGVSEAVAFLESAERPPRLLLIDLSDTDTPMSDIDRLAEACEPSIVVVAVGEKNNVHLFRDLMRSGVADYITKPLIPELLEPYVRDRRGGVHELGRSARRGKIICFAGARGGVGATTLAVGCAWRLANVESRRVALLDLDLHSGSCCIQLGLQSGGLRDALANHKRLDALYLERVSIKSGTRLSVLADEVPIMDRAEIADEALDSLLSALAEEHHYIVIDLPATLSPLHSKVMQASRARVIVADRTLPGLRDAGRLLEESHRHLNPSLLVVNDHHPGLAGAMDKALIKEALSRGPDIEIAYDRRAAQRVDNLGEAIAKTSSPVGEGVGAISAWLSGKRPRAQRKFSLSLFGSKS